MSNHELAHLRRRLLRFFLEDGARQTGELLELPEMRSYNPRWLCKLVHSLEWAGLLDKFGATSGTWYLTNHTGYIVLVTLDETLTDKRPPEPRSSIE
jgi:hypothetical protein